MDAPRLRPRLTAAFSTAVLAVCALALGLLGVGGWSQVADPMVAVLVVAGLVANVVATRWDGSVLVSGGFAVDMLAAGLFGPAAAFLVATVAEIGAWVVAPTRRLYLLNNLAAAGAPALAAGLVMSAVGAEPAGLAFLAALALAATGAHVLHLGVYAVQAALYSGAAIRRTAAAIRPTLGSDAIAIGLTVPLAAILHRAGLPAAVFLLVTLLAYARMAQLVVVARDRAQEHAALSWGVLSGLLRALELREPHAARHAAAVASFARDIARASGMDERRCELAHTAGLLHDIGLLAPGPRPRADGAPLDAHDWEAIRLHPVVGADLLRDLTLYGPVAEIVRSHHERVDGRGYPDGLSGADIPALSRVVAVAETYDTLTATGGYRDATSSFEAVRELRRVAGTQLDAEYVEALARVLAGRDVGYRHADEADFERELDLERRIADAATRGLGARRPVLEPS